MKNDAKPDSGTEVKVHEDAVAGQGTLALEKESHGTQGLRHLCERCKEARPNGARQVQSLHATLGKGPMHPCERGTGPGKVQRSKAKSAGKTDPREMYPRR